MVVGENGEPCFCQPLSGVKDPLFQKLLVICSGELSTVIILFAFVPCKNGKLERHSTSNGCRPQ